MKFLPPDLEDAMELSASDPNKAAEVLLIAAKYLKGREMMPDALAYYLADAFERAMKKASVFRGSQLLMNLHLEVHHRRVAANFEYVGFDLDRLLQAKEQKGKAILDIGEKYSLSESTVKRMYKKYQAFKAHEAESDSLLQQQLQEGYAPPSVTSKKPKNRV
jgi:hypothetical protein